MPEAEVNLGIMNVGFGDTIYHSAMESEAAYIGRGPTHSSYVARNHFTHIIFKI